MTIVTDRGPVGSYAYRDNRATRKSHFRGLVTHLRAADPDDDTPANLAALPNDQASASERRRQYEQTADRLRTEALEDPVAFLSATRTMRGQHEVLDEIIADAEDALEDQEAAEAERVESQQQTQQKAAKAAREAREGQREADAERNEALSESGVAPARTQRTPEAVGAPGESVTAGGTLDPDASGFRGDYSEDWSVPQVLSWVREAPDDDQRKARANYALAKENEREEPRSTATDPLERLANGGDEDETAAAADDEADGDDDLTESEGEGGEGDEPDPSESPVEGEEESEQS